MFWPLKSCSKFSGVPEDSQVPFSGVWVATSQLPQNGVAIVEHVEEQVDLQKPILKIRVEHIEEQIDLQN